MDIHQFSTLILKKSKRTDVLNYIDIFLDITSYMPTDWTIQQKAWHIIHNTLTVPTCEQCSNNAKFLSNKYWNWCSNTCMGSDPDVLLKKQQTNLKKYGTEHPQRLIEFKDKQKQTILDRYGVDNYAKSSEFLIKSKETSQREYGVDNPSKNADIKKKISQKAKERDHESVKLKRKETYLNTIGKPHNSNSHLSDESIQKLNDIDFLYDEHFIKKKSCQQIANELGCSPTPVLTNLSKAGYDIIRHNISKEEAELLTFLSLYTTDIKTNIRSIIPPFELDFYIPSYNIAIEMNGIYWHSELNGKNKKYHLNKTEMCYNKGIKLIHIFDSEWNQKQEIVKSRLECIFKKLNKIHARKCKIKEIDSKLKSTFINNNHLQGDTNSTVNLGLFHNNELVSVMTFSKSRYNTSYDWELIRFCNLLHTSVVGGASKLFSYFKKHYNPMSIISYADRRWSDGNLYQQIGFNFLQFSSPNYYYINLKNIQSLDLNSRIQFQKHKLKDKLLHYDEKLTEWENMKNNNYDRIWDCGNYVYGWSIK